MYQKLAALIIILLLQQSVSAQVIQDIPDKQNTKHYKLNGGVQKVVQETYRVAIGGDLEYDVDTFSPADTSHMIAGELVLGFNDNKRLTIKKRTTYNIKRGKVDNEFIWSYNYDDEDKLISFAQTEDGKVIDSTVVEYDSRGRLDEMVVYDRKDRILGRKQFSYKNGKPFNIRIKDENNAIKNFVRLQYNSKGKVKERQFRGSSLQVLAIQQYKRRKTKEGNLQSNIYDYVEGDRFHRLYSSLYDKNGNEIQRTVTDSNKRVIEYRTLVYNKQGELTKEIAFTDVKLVVTYLYRYDSNGNWVEQQVFHDGIPYEVRRRSISYYPAKGAE